VPELDRPAIDPTINDLAEAFGIATEYWDWQGRHVTVARDTIVAVLAALDIDASTPEAAAAALANHDRHPWTQMLPPCMVMREQRTASGVGPCAPW
jgi:4-alpha-glucanotransferase